MRSKATRHTNEKRTPALAPGLPIDSHDEELLDEALTETFPASDPVAVPIPKNRAEPDRHPRRKR